MSVLRGVYTRALGVAYEPISSPEKEALLANRPESFMVFKEGTELALALFVERHAKDSPFPRADMVQRAIDVFCYSRHWMMHMGDLKVRHMVSILILHVLGVPFTPSIFATLTPVPTRNERLILPPSSAAHRERGCGTGQSQQLRYAAGPGAGVCGDGHLLRLQRRGTVPDASTGT